MKRKCSFIKRYFSKGRFGESFQDLSEEVISHADHCVECRKALEELTMIEKKVWSSSVSNDGLEHSQMDKLKHHVMKKINEKSTESSVFSLSFLPVRIAAIATLLVALSATGYFYFVRQDTHRTANIGFEDKIASVDPKLLDDVVFEYSDIDEIDESIIEAALIDEITNSMYDAVDASETGYGSNWIYRTETLNFFQDFDEKDWEALRRYLT
ncbi:hypothetical protein JW979_08155 [bacterium]|nr:hypothetical protein [candidate division CSSED10-310 bacterium]